MVQNDGSPRSRHGRPGPGGRRRLPDPSVPARGPRFDRRARQDGDRRGPEGRHRRAGGPGLGRASSSATGASAGSLSAPRGAAGPRSLRASRMRSPSCTRVGSPPVPASASVAGSSPRTSAGAERPRGGRLDRGLAGAPTHPRRAAGLAARPDLGSVQSRDGLGPDLSADPRVPVGPSDGGMVVWFFCRDPLRR